MLSDSLPQASEEFVYLEEDVIDACTRPYDSFNANYKNSCYEAPGKRFSTDL